MMRLIMISSYDEYMRSQGNHGLAPMNTPSSKQDYAQFVETYKEPIVQPLPAYDQPRQVAQGWRKRASSSEGYGEYENDYQDSLNELEDYGVDGEKRKEIRKASSPVEKPPQQQEQVDPQAEDQVNYRAYLREYNMHRGF